MHRQNPPRFPLTSEPGRVFYFYDDMNIYTKQPLSIADQIARLKAQGLVINDEELATKILGEVSYFRFAAYLRPMEADKQTHQFKPGSTFENAVALYEFDNALRQLLFTAIQRIEVALRSKIIQHFSMRHGTFWFMQMPLHDSEHRFLENLGALDREVSRSKEDFIKEHFRNYDKPEFPPAWKTLELASFGTLSKLSYNFADKKVKKLVAREFNLPQHEVLESWIRSLSALRNHCAHHARLWNRYLNATPQMNAHMRGNWITNRQIDPNKLYAVLCCIVYWLDAMNRGEEFRSRFSQLLAEYPSVDTAAMGFPQSVTDALALLTHDEAVPYPDYVAAVKKNPVAAAVKLADLRHNSDLSRLDAVYEAALRRREKYQQAMSHTKDRDAITMITEIIDSLVKK